MNKEMIAGSVAGLALVGVISLVSFGSDAAGTVIVRGIVKSGGSGDSVNVYITHVGTAPDATAIRGVRTDVKVSGAKKWKWQSEGGTLTKVRTSSNPTPEKEVVLKGTLQSDNRITASWMVTNYREFHIEGKLQARDLDTAPSSIDSGYVTVNVEKVVMRNITPERAWKADRLVGKDLRVRVNGSSKVRSIGTTKDWDGIKSQNNAARASEVEIHLDEVSEGQQQVVIEGQMTDEDNWTASQYWQRNQ